MIILSEITGKEYDSVSECLYDEQKFKTEQEEARKAEEAHKKEVDEAYQAAIDACEKYFELIGRDIKAEFEEYFREDEDDEDGEDLQFVRIKLKDGETIDEAIDRIMESI